jgi:hypothetical protein
VQTFAGRECYLTKFHTVEESCSFDLYFCIHDTWLFLPKRKHVSFINCCEASIFLFFLAVTVVFFVESFFVPPVLLFSFYSFLLVHKPESPCTYFAMFLKHSAPQCNNVLLENKHSNGLDRREFHVFTITSYQPLASLGWLSAVRGNTSVPPVSHFTFPEQSTDAVPTKFRLLLQHEPLESIVS